MSSKRTRPKTAHVAFTTEERQKLEELAAERGITISTWMRLTIRDEHAKLRARRAAEVLSTPGAK